MPSYFWSGSCFFMDADGNGSQKEPSTRQELRSVDEGAGKSEKDGPALTTGLSGGRVDAPESARGQAAVESKAEVPESVEDQGKNNAATTESVKREADLSQNMADSADMPEPLETKVPAERPQKPARKGLSPPCLLKELGLKVTAKGVLLPESRKTLLRRRRETRQALKNEADGAMVSTAVKRKPFACVSGAVQLDEVESDLFYGAHQGSVSTCAQAVAKGASVNVRTKADLDGVGIGATALHVAAVRGHEDVVAALLHGKADALAVTGRGETPVQLATRMGHVEVVKVLRAAGAAPQNAEGVMQLMAQAPSAWRDGQRKKLRKAIGGERRILSPPPPPPPPPPGPEDRPEESHPKGKGKGKAKGKRQRKGKEKD
ncbi:unnamed protein product [Durusdinium trenchii]|uniref:Uncharacterized protein n=2 Tax=Durusdinium trenchii TaxID=1381693 RepID=A0ABP0L4W3_9DINO